MAVGVEAEAEAAVEVVVGAGAAVVVAVEAEEAKGEVDGMADGEDAGMAAVVEDVKVQFAIKQLISIVFCVRFNKGINV